MPGADKLGEIISAETGPPEVGSSPVVPADAGLAEAASDGIVASAEPIPEQAAYSSAVKLLELMKAHHKGAPPPHSQAAQQIQAQQRIVGTARLKLEQARQRAAKAELSPLMVGLEGAAAAA